MAGTVGVARTQIQGVGLDHGRWMRYAILLVKFGQVIVLRFFWDIQGSLPLTGGMGDLSGQVLVDIPKALTLMQRDKCQRQPKTARAI